MQRERKNNPDGIENRSSYDSGSEYRLQPPEDSTLNKFRLKAAL